MEWSYIVTARHLSIRAPDGTLSHTVTLHDLLYDGHGSAYHESAPVVAVSPSLVKRYIQTVILGGRIWRFDENAKVVGTQSEEIAMDRETADRRAREIREAYHAPIRNMLTLAGSDVWRTGTEIGALFGQRYPSQGYEDIIFRVISMVMCDALERDGDTWSQDTRFRLRG